MALFSEEHDAIDAFVAAAKADARHPAFPAADNAAAVGALKVILAEAIDRLSDEDRGAMLRIMDRTAQEFYRRVKAKTEDA